MAEKKNTIVLFRLLGLWQSAFGAVHGRSYIDIVITRWRLRRSTHIGAIVTDHHAAAGAARRFSALSVCSEPCLYESSIFFRIWSLGFVVTSLILKSVTCSFE